MRLLVAAAVGVGCWAGLAPAQGEDHGAPTTPGSPVLVRMQQLAEAFLDVERALAAGRLESAKQPSRRLVELLASDPFAGVGDERLRRRYDARNTVSALRGKELTAHVARGDLVSAGIALERVRVSCIACHAVHRKRNSERGWFPALQNSVWGRVTVRDKPGNLRQSAAGVVVFLEEDNTPASAPPPRADAPEAVPVPDKERPPIVYPRIVQKDMRFHPRILPIVVGSTVDFPNDDTVLHNVFSLSKARRLDLGVYGRGTTKRRTFEKTGLVRLFCNIHPSMSASVVVLENRHFAVSDEAGVFVITAIPDGNYRVRSWHGLGGGKSVAVQLTGGRVVRQDFDIRESKRTVPHKNKFGLPYKKKY